MLDIKDADRDVGYELADIAATSLVPPQPGSIPLHAIPRCDAFDTWMPAASGRK
jgi:hypothetical protein